MWKETKWELDYRTVDRLYALLRVVKLPKDLKNRHFKGVSTQMQRNNGLSLLKAKVKLLLKKLVAWT